MQSFLFSHHLLCGLPDPAVRRDHKVVTSKMYTQCTQSAVDAISASIGTLKGDIGVDLWRTRANQILEQANLPVMDYSGESANSKAVLKAARERWIAMERGNTTPADAVASYNVPKMLFGLPHATTQVSTVYSSTDSLSNGDSIYSSTRNRRLPLAVTALLGKPAGPANSSRQLWLRWISLPSPADAQVPTRPDLMWTWYVK